MCGRERPASRPAALAFARPNALPAAYVACNYSCLRLLIFVSSLGNVRLGGTCHTTTTPTHELATRGGGAQGRTQARTFGFEGLGEIEHVSVVVLRQLSQEGRDVIHVLEVVGDLLILLNFLR